MPEAVTVKVPRDLVPRFPDRCLRCGAAADSPGVRLSALPTGWTRFFFWWWLGGRYTVYAPACEQCRAPLRRGRLARGLARWIVVGGGAFVLFVVVGRLALPARMLWVMGGVALWSILFELYLERQPPLLDITVYGDHVDYEFRDAVFARDFIHANAGPNANSSSLP